MDQLASASIFGALCFAVFLCLKGFDRRLTLLTGLTFAIYMALDDLATVLPALAPSLRLFSGSWNWTGKLYSIVLSLIVLAALRMDRQATGLTFAQKNLKSSLVAVTLLVMLSCGIGFIFQPGMPSLETLAFQITMPGIAEEIAYRGIAPALLLGLTHRKSSVVQMPWAVICITGAAFGLWHGLGYSNGALSFDTMSAIFPFVGGIAYGWLRFHSGSLLLPVIAHGLGNSVFYLSAVVA